MNLRQMPRRPVGFSSIPPQPADLRGPRFGAQQGREHHGSACPADAAAADVATALRNPRSSERRAGHIRRRIRTIRCRPPGEDRQAVAPWNRWRSPLVGPLLPLPSTARKSRFWEMPRARRAAISVFRRGIGFDDERQANRPDTVARCQEIRH
jgi:hypothetical protein